MEYYVIMYNGEFTLCTQAGAEVISAKMEDAGIYEDPDPMYQDKLERYIEEKTGIPADAWEIG